MSQLQQFSPDADKSNKPVVLTWQDFVQVVLGLTIQAYQIMKSARIAKVEWDEDDFTILLEEHIRPIAYDYDYPIFIHSRKKQHTKDMKIGKRRTKTAKETDLFCMVVGNPIMTKFTLFGRRKELVIEKHIAV